MAGVKLDLGWMRIFNEVARAGSLTLAASRLGLSQPAVSYQVRRIEEQLQAPLFQRQHRGVALTPEGRRLFDVVSRSVDDIDGTVRSLRPHPARPAIRLKTDYAFSTLWLLPHMYKFRATHAETDIQLVAAHREADPRVEEGEAAVVFGTRAEFEGQGTLLLPESVAPICTPRFLERHGPLGKAQALTLLHLDTLGPSPWYDWPGYFRDAGIDPAPNALKQGELCFNTYALVVQAALADEGVALGWLGLVDQLIASRLLVIAGPQLSAPDRGYWLLLPEERTEGMDQLCAWLSSEFSSAAG